MLDFLRYYAWLHRGILPAAGGIADQSATFIEAASVFEADLADYDSRKPHGRGDR